jgi:predicted acetyltransferase
VERVHPVAQDEARAWVAALATTLLGSPYDDDFPRRVDRWARDWLPERTWAYREAGRVIATLATEPRTLTVPGPAGGTRDLEADALTGVTVAATHRRRGLLRTMIGESLAAAKDRGDALSMLIAAEWPIYGRFGYAPAAFGASFVYHTKRLNAALPAPPAGALRQVEAAELATIAPHVFDTARRRRAGQVDRRHPWWNRRLSLDGYEPIGKQPNWFVHEGPDGPDGLLAWRVSRDFELDGKLGEVEVVEFVDADDAAYRDMWAYLAAIDVVGEVKLTDRPVDELIRWLLPDARALELTGTFDYLWLRILDVPAALSARSYAAPGRVVLEVTDEDAGGCGAGRFALDADDADAQCTTTTDPPDLVLSQRVLAACYLGGHRLRQLATYGVEERTPGALTRADLMFSAPLAPLNQTGF